MAAFGMMPAQHNPFRIILLLLALFYVKATGISNLKKCADKACSVTISRATALARFPASSPLHLSLARGDVIEIKSKSAGNKPDLWSGEVRGRRGYFPKSFVREFEVLIDNPTFDLPTEENEWDTQPKQPPPEMPPPAEVKDEAKDETEVDETDLTDLENLGDQAGQETQPSLEQPASTSEDGSAPDEPVNEQAEAKEEEPGGWFGVQMGDPLIRDIEEIQKSFPDMNEVHEDTQAFNSFLSKQFGSGDAAFASVPEKPDPSQDSSKQESDVNAENMATGNIESEPSENSAEQEFVTKPDDGGAGTDDGNIGSDDTQPIPVDPADVNVEEARPEEKEAKVSQERKEIEENPYIAGVSVLEDEEEDEGYEDEEEELSQEDSSSQAEPETTEEKAPETAPGYSQDAGTQTESDDPTEVGEDVKEEQTAEGSDTHPAVNTNAHREDKPEPPVSSQDNTVDPRWMAEERDAVKQVMKDLPSVLLDEAPNQKAADKLQPQDSTEATQPPQVEVPEGSATGTGADDAKQVVDQKLTFQSEKSQNEAETLVFQSEKSKEDASEPLVHSKELKEADANKDSPAGLHPDSSGTPPEPLPQGEVSEEASSPVEQQTEQETVKEQPVVRPEENLAPSQETVKEQPVVQPEENLAPSQETVKEHPVVQLEETLAPSPVPPVHQPVDIDFVAGQVQGSNSASLESSQSMMGQHPLAHTPALEDTAPSVEQAAPGVRVNDNSAVPPVKTEEAQAGKSDTDEPKPTTLIDGTRFYLENGEIADIVPESVPVHDANTGVSAPIEPEMSSLPPEPAESIQPTATTPMPEMSAPPLPVETPSSLDASTLAPTPQIPQAAPQTVQNSTEGPETLDATDVPPKNPNIPKVDSHMTISGHEYHTNADFLGRKVLSVNSQPGDQAAPPSEERAQPILTPDQVVKETQDQQSNSQASEGSPEQLSSELSSEVPAQVDSPPTEEVQPKTSENAGKTSVTIEGEDEPAGDHPHHKTSDEHAAQPSSQPAAETDAKTSDEPVPTQADSAEEDRSSSQGTEGGRTDSVTPTPNPLDWDDVPPPPAAGDVTPPPDDMSDEEPTLEGDPYQMDDYYSRKINDEELMKAEDEAAAYASGTVGSLDAQSKAFIDKLPPSIQSLLEQEPLGLSPGMTVLVTMTTFVVFISVTCFSCLCTPSGKKAGTKDPLVVVRELEEKLLIAVKEKENLEDMLQERQTEVDTGNDMNKRLKSEFGDLQSRSGTAKSDLQNVTLHNEVLKNQVATFQTEIAELKGQLSKKADDIKSKDKKSKESEKETKKLQEVKQKMEQNLQKKENERQRLADENENLKSTVQSLTDQVQLLETSKQQAQLMSSTSSQQHQHLTLLSEAEDWREKVDELKESLSQAEQENRQAQETITFKDNELEVMKDCYLQLKSFEKPNEGGEEDEDFDAGNSEDLQEKIKAMMDVTKVNATLRAVQEEKDNLDNKLKIENDARRELEEQLECVRREMESSMADKMKAERQSQEAQTKLNVLSSYFKDKELQLQRELGEHEALKKQNLSKLDNADENTRTLQKELELSKQQVDSLKRELTASERDFRSQIAANEKKAHENWLNARAAERELKEIRHEAAVLRQKLTDVERRNMEPGLIRPLPTRGMPPPGMLNGPPPPGMERSPSRGSLPPGVMPPGPPPPPFREGEFAAMSPRDLERLPPSHPARHMQPPPEARSPPPRMLPPDSRGSPPRMMPLDARSPPPYDRRGPPGPPHPHDSRSPPMRMPPPDMGPPMRGPFPPHMGPPMGSPGPRMDSPRDRQGQGQSQYGRHPPSGGEGRRHQSQV